jgi:hypothetical protein
MRPRGAAHPRSKLTDAQALAILSDTRPLAEITAEYGVSRATISNIRHRKRWAHLAPDGTDRLSEKEIREIREAGERLAAAYGVSRWVIAEIINHYAPAAACARSRVSAGP